MRNIFYVLTLKGASHFRDGSIGKEKLVAVAVAEAEADTCRPEY